MAHWRLQALAKPERWTARKLAAATGLAYTTVWGLWSGNAERADLRTLQRLADVLGRQPGELIGGGDAPTQPPSDPPAGRVPPD